MAFLQANISKGCFSCTKLRRTRLFTVPNGMSSWTAISAWLKPLKNARQTHCRSFGSSSRNELAM
jgi:hypothetical protein